MKLTRSLLPLCISSLASASFFGNNQAVLEDKDLQVPGENPLTFCSEDVGKLLIINHVNLAPNPPQAGVTLTLEASGNFTEEIQEGAYVWLTVKYGLIRLIYEKQDLCDAMSNVDKQCPLEKGKTTVTKDIDLPSQIPPGNYHVTADVFTVDDRPITCLEASIKFSR